MSQIRMKTSLKEGSFLLKTLDDFELPGFELADIRYYGNAEMRAALIGFVFGSAKMNHVGKALNDMLQSMEEEEIPLETICDVLEKEGSKIDQIGEGRYFGKGSHKDYCHQAELAVEHVDPACRTYAYAHVLIYCWMFRRQFSDFSEREKKAMLSPWTGSVSMQADKQAADTAWGEDIVIPEQGMEFILKWENVKGKPLMARRLVNPHTQKVCITLLTPMDRRKIWVPANGKLNACFAQDQLVSIRGNIRSRKNAAWIIDGQQNLFRLDALRNRMSRTKISEKKVLDFAIGAYERLYLLCEDGLHLPDKQIIQNVIGIYAADNVWVALKADGSTQSNQEQYCRENVHAVVETPNGLILVDRQNSLEAMDIMMSRFDAGNSKFVEKAYCGGVYAGIDGAGSFMLEEAK